MKREGAARMEGSSTEPVRHCFLETPIGRLRLAGDRTSLREISFPNRVPAAQSRDEHPGVPLEAPLREAARQLEAYFAGELDRFDLPLAPEGTAFQKEVWALLREIPYGETSSYGSLARRLGRPAASRAVGAANGRNPIPIVIPCHRVVGADGSLTGFGGGLPIKRQLLALEAIHCIALRSRSVAGP